jgi:hypothetical protein
MMALVDLDGETFEKIDAGKIEGSFNCKNISDIVPNAADKGTTAAWLFSFALKQFQ